MYPAALFAGEQEEPDADVEDFDSLSDDEPETEASVVSHFVRATVRKEGRKQARKNRIVNRRDGVVVEENIKVEREEGGRASHRSLRVSYRCNLAPFLLFVGSFLN